MPTLNKEFKQAIKQLPVSELQKLVIQAAAKNREIYDMINLQYISGKEAEKELFERTKEQALNELYFAGNRGIFQKNLSKALGKAVKHINHYVKVTKHKEGEAELLLAVLTEVFENHANQLGTCWTVYDSKLAITTNRLFNLVTKKLQEDYWIEYKEPLNRFLKILHTQSNHLDYVYSMQNSF